MFIVFQTVKAFYVEESVITYMGRHVAVQLDVSKRKKTSSSLGDLWQRTDADRYYCDAKKNMRPHVNRSPRVFPTATGADIGLLT